MANSDTGRCSGHCCRAFSLRFSPDELKERASRLRDGEQIRDMVIYLGLKTDAEAGMHRDDRTEEKEHFYTCKHLSPDGNCGNYDNRPRMCRDFPYGRTCAYDACTWADAEKSTSRDT